MIALIAAGTSVRGGRWINGAPTHIFPEMLTELENRGWVLVRASELPPSVATIEQRLENESVHRLRDTGICPTCGHHADHG